VPEWRVQSLLDLRDEKTKVLDRCVERLDNDNADRELCEILLMP